MPNSNVSRGKANERAAAAMLNDVFGQQWNFRRKLGEGRLEDEGDLTNDIDPRLTIQVKVANPRTFSSAVRAAAEGAARQNDNANGLFAFGLTKVPNARREPKWLVSTLEWPLSLDGYSDITVVGTTMKALDLIASGKYALVIVERAGVDDMVISTIEAFHDAYYVSMQHLVDLRAH